MALSTHCATSGTSSVSLAVTSRSVLHNTPLCIGRTSTRTRVVPASNRWGVTCTWSLSATICPGPPCTSNSAVAPWPGVSVPKSRRATLTVRC